MPVMEISIVPLGTQTTSVSTYVANAVKLLKKQKGIKYKLTSMGTIIEADSLRKLLNIANKMHNTMFKLNIKRVVTTIKIDDRKDKKLTINGKINSVQKKLVKVKLLVFNKIKRKLKKQQEKQIVEFIMKEMLKLKKEMFCYLILRKKGK